MIDAVYATSMRTTLTLDDDLAGILEEKAREMGMSFKEVVNRTIRAGLGEPARRRRGPAPRVIPHSFGFKPGIDLDKLNQLADELEVDAAAEKWQRQAGDPSRRKRSRARS